MQNQRSKANSVFEFNLSGTLSGKEGSDVIAKFKSVKNHNINVDVSHIQNMDLAGFNILIMMHQHAKLVNKKMLLTGAHNPVVLKWIKLTKMDLILQTTN